MVRRRTDQSNDRGASSSTWLFSMAQLGRHEKQTAVEMVARDQQIRLRVMLIGQWSALFVALCVIGCSTYLVAAGHEISGTVLGTVDLVALTRVFLPGRAKEQEDGPTST